MTARILDGRPIAKSIEAEVALRVEREKAKGVDPSLRVVLIGSNSPSLAYARMIERACKRTGVLYQLLQMDASVSRAEAFEKIEELNQDPSLHGIIIKRPLPASLGDELLLQSLSPKKDIDGCHFENLGRLVVWGAPAGHIPCTPAGVLEILRRSGIKIKGKHAVVLGRSVTVGKPLANLLLQKDPWADATVTLCHSSTANLEEHTRSADLLVAAIGVPNFVKPDMVRPGATVVDVGTNSIHDPSSPRGYRLVGDVDFESVKEVAGAITPVPGGVGPVTTAILMQNLMDTFDQKG